MDTPTSKLSNITTKTKILAWATLIALTSILNSCHSAKEDTTTHHNIKFVVYYDSWTHETLSYKSTYPLQLSYFGGTNHIDEIKSVLNKKILFETTAPVKVLENK